MTNLADPTLSTAGWALIIGALMISMALSSTLLKRLPVSTSMLYLAFGYALGPAGWGLLTPDPLIHSGTLEVITEFVLLISLFSVGLKLGLPLRDKRWYLPLLLAFPAMAMTVLMIAVIGVYGLGLPLGAAVLLGGILAPTDPVLAADVQVADSDDNDRMRFSLSAEGGLNDGAAFPFVMLGLGLLGLHDLGGGWRWLIIDLLWAQIGGLLIGALLGIAIGKLVIYLRARYHTAAGLDEFLALGLIAIVYGIAQLSAASGFLAVFAAGLAMQRTKTHLSIGILASAVPTSERPLQIAKDSDEPSLDKVQIHAHMMVEAVQGFNEQMERLAELGVVMIVGAMLSYVTLPTGAIWFLPLFFLVIRPVAVWLTLSGAAVSREQRRLIGWLGIRGIGSVYYLTYVINHSLAGSLVGEITALTLATVAASILLHGISVTPLMDFYARRSLRRRRSRHS